MAVNPFDQFDEPKENPFDRFDSPDQPGITPDEVRKIAIQSAFGDEKVDFTSGGDFKTRFNVAFFGDTDEEKAAEFKNNYPQGVLKRVNIPEMGESYLVFKKNVNDKSEVPKTFEDFSDRATGESGITLRDTAEMLANAPEAIGAAAMAAVTRGASLPAQMGGVGVGAAGGRLTKEGLQSLRGTQRQPAIEVLYDAGEEAALAATGLAAGHAMNKLLNIKSGEGVFKTSEDQDELLKELSKPEYSELRKKINPKQIAPENKITGRLIDQATSTTGKVEKQTKEAIEGVQSQVKEFSDIPIDEVGGANFPVIVGHELRKETRKALAKGNALIKSQTPAIELREGGVAAKTTLARDYPIESAKVRNSLYAQVDEAAERENPVFDLKGSLETVTQIRHRIANETAEGELSQAPFPKELLNVMDDLEKIAAQQTDYRALKTLRTRLFNLIDNEPWQWDINKKDARRLWDSLTDSLKNPINANVKAAAIPGQKSFKQAFQDASSFTRNRHKVLEATSTRAIVNSDKPGAIIEQLMKPHQYTDEINEALSVSPKKKALVIDGIKTNWIIQNPGRATKKLDEFKRRDPDGFRKIVNAREEDELYRVADLSDRLNNSQASKVIENATIAGRQVTQLLKNQDKLELEGLIKLYGGKESDGAKLLKAGMLEDMLHQSTVDTAKGVTVDSKKFAALVRNYNRNGALDVLLTDKEKTQLLFLNRIVQVLKPSFDSGTSLEAAQLISQLKSPSSFLAGVRGLGFNKAASWILINPKATRLLLGSGQKGPSRVPLKAGSAMLSTLLGDLDASSKRLEALENQQDTQAQPAQ